MRKVQILFVITLMFIISSCEIAEQESTTEMFPLYVPKDVVSKERGYETMVPVIYQMIPIAKDNSLEDKLQSICDSVSRTLFRSLIIDLTMIEDSQSYKVAHINLVDQIAGEGNKPLGEFEGWHPSFQGSSGGRYTTIILVENILQRHYKGEWIDAVIFYHRSIRIDVAEHTNLVGPIFRY